MITNDAMGDPPSDSAMFLAAERELAGACVGWRRHQRCVDEDDRQLPDPHPACLAAHRRYLVFLIDHGLLSRDHA